MGRGDRGRPINQRKAQQHYSEERQMREELSSVPRIPEFPEKAGVATLRLDERATWPSRDGEVITLPKILDTEFFPLKGGEQFLFGMANSRGNRTEGFLRLYFGGTDERPFLVELQGRAFKNFVEGGEDGFYEGLKPEPIARAERTWGLRRTKRQGDIFAYQLPFDWEDLARHHDDRRQWAIGYEGRRNLFSTRHALTGWVLFYNAGRMMPPTLCELNSVLYQRIIVEDGRIVVGEGVVEAPDHKSLFLEGPHLLIQTKYLADAANAD